MKIGNFILNEDVLFTIVAYHETENGNVALLIRDEECLYVTVRDLTRQRNGKYHWYYGNYTKDFDAAAQDYSDQKATLF